ncbi:MAG TPA: M20/M25/M40 family metallo-hydrolase [Planctomycetota bacterium]|nr:M20/M25/M40 family metallo-hydrolase [Planctomycetota bacterium]
MTEDIDPILKKVEALRGRMTELLTSLIEIPSVNPYSGDEPPEKALAAGRHEARAQSFFAERLEKDLGAHVDRFETPADIYAQCEQIADPTRQFAGRPSLVASWSAKDRPATPGVPPTQPPAVVINGHMDTVGVDGMSIDPFKAQIKDGRLYGRGSSDCKGGLVAAYGALLACRELSIDLAGRAVFECVTDEECSGCGSGTLSAIQRGYRGNLAYSIDGQQRFTIGSGGLLEFEAVITGRTGQPLVGAQGNAIRLMAQVVLALNRWADAPQEKRSNGYLNTAIIHGGTHAGQLPARCSLRSMARYNFEQAVEARELDRPWGGALVFEEIQRYVKHALGDEPWLSENPIAWKITKDLTPWRSPLDHPLVKAVRQNICDVTGATTEGQEMLAWMDAAHQARLALIPSIAYGVADHGQAHSHNESVSLDAVVRCAQALAVTLARAKS